MIRVTAACSSESGKLLKKACTSRFETSFSNAWGSITPHPPCTGTNLATLAPQLASVAGLRPSVHLDHGAQGAGADLLALAFQLAAGGEDIVPAKRVDLSCVAVTVHDCSEALEKKPVRPLVIRARPRIEGDQ